MDDVYSMLLEEIGVPMYRQEVPPSSISRYQGLLPDALLQLWSEHGWCGYGEGLFWMVNPQEYDSVAASWIQGSPLEKIDIYHVIARSAFGDLYLWGEKSGPSLCIFSNVSRYTYDPAERSPKAMDRAFQSFLLSFDRDYLDFNELFNASKEYLGVLSPDEIYGFVPALQIGGSAKIEHIEKVKTIEHLMLLSQLGELHQYTLSDI
ncbi:GAD-like domain-containing protein [Pseudomonas alloputida]|uniref:GAD-like domain-containing protein n=1 Tax=Pseudomonas TaxID=286 RepID=UPI003EE9C106